MRPVKIDYGIAAAIGAAALFGLSTPLAKLLVGEMPPLLLAGVMYAGSGIGLAALFIVRAISPVRDTFTWPRGIDWCWLIGAMAAGGVIGPYLLLYGLQRTDSASASLILNLEGVFTALLAWFVFNENFDRKIAVGMGLIVAGGVVLSVGPALRAHSFVGPTAIALACLAWAIDNNLTRKVAVHDAIFIACAKGLVSGAVSITLALAHGERMPSTSVVPEAAILGFFSYGLSLALYVIALRTLGTARTGAYFSLAPFLGASLAVALGTPLTASLVASAVLMGAGVWLYLTEYHEHWHRHGRLEHAHLHAHDEHHAHQHGREWDGKEPHSHPHTHEPIEHAHRHYPDVHHRHEH